MTDQAFTDEQKRYLEGFTSGLQIGQKLKSLGTLQAIAQAPQMAAAVPVGPEATHHQAQDRFLAQGKQLVAEEKAKREKHPLDRWQEFVNRAQAGEFPKGADVFCTKFFGLFYTAPAQDAYMCRLRLPNGILNVYQLRGVADLAQRYAGGYAHVTTRANLQIREIGARDGPSVLMGLYELGIVNRGAGADNIRNVTGSPIAGIDPQEIIDTRPWARELHYYILNHRELYGLPRKLNIGFDGGGRISVLEDTNDIGFVAVRVGEGKSLKPRVYFRLQLGGITGHQDFARDTGVILKPEECTSVAAAVVRVFIEAGDRTDRTKARLKYVLDSWGLDRFMAEVKKRLPFDLQRLPLDECEPRAPIDKLAHIGVHKQTQEDCYYIGVVLEVGRLSVEQMRGLADVAKLYGSGTIRLTVWQNLLISDVNRKHLEAAKSAIKDLGLDYSTNNIRAGLVACTGNTGCKFSASNTKHHATQIAEFVEQRIKLDLPINIHLTGCHHSCAQHYIGDIGLLACKVSKGDDEEDTEGYHVYVGGGYGQSQRLAAELQRDVVAEHAPAFIEKLLAAYLTHRKAKDEGFAEFANRHSKEELLDLMNQKTVQAA